jgi:hypothetical protein
VSSARELPIAGNVPGDLLPIPASDVVAADTRIVSAADLLLVMSHGCQIGRYRIFRVAHLAGGADTATGSAMNATGRLLIVDYHQGTTSHTLWDLAHPSPRHSPGSITHREDSVTLAGIRLASW